MATAKMYGKAAYHAFNGNFNYSTADVKVALVTAYTPDQDHEFFDAITKTECPQSGNYLTGGQALGTKTLNYDTATNTFQLKAANTVWTSSTISNALYAIVYNNTPASSKPLLCYVDFGGAQTSSNGDFTIAWNGGVVAAVQAV